MTDQEAMEKAANEVSALGSMQFEQGWTAALAWLRSQGEPVVWEIHTELSRFYTRDKEEAERYAGNLYDVTPLYIAPRPVMQQEPVAYLSSYYRDVIYGKTDCVPLGAEVSFINLQWPNQIPLYAAPQPAIPDGWRLVPVEPTEEMLNAAGPRPTNWDATYASRRLREQGDELRREE